MTRTLSLILALVASPAWACVSVNGLPDPACSPGAIDPQSSQEAIRRTICVSGYTKTVRPPVSVTNRIKKERMQAYGLAGQPMKDYELDHIVSLELFGCADCVENLYPQPWHGPYNAHMKDRLENLFHELVCSGQLPLADAQAMIATDWVAAYRKYFCEGDECAP